MPGLASRCRCRSTGQARHMQRLDVSEASSAGSWRKLMQKKDTLPVHKRHILLLTVDLLLESIWKPSRLVSARHILLSACMGVDGETQQPLNPKPPLDIMLPVSRGTSCTNLRFPGIPTAVYCLSGCGYQRG